MEQMYCKVCGYQGGAGETACPECGAPLHAVESAPSAHETLTPTGAEKIKKREKRPPGQKAALVRRVACLLALCLVLQGLGLWSLTWRRDRGAWSTAWWGSDLVTPQGVWRLGEDFWVMAGDSSRPQKLLRRVNYGSSLLSLDERSSLHYYYDGHTLEPTDWLTATISGDGRVLFYLRREGEDTVLYRRDLDRGPARAVDRAPTIGPALGIISAWDGSAAVWSAADSVELSRARLTQRRWDRRRGGQALEGESYSISALGRNGDSTLIDRVTPLGLNEFEWSTVLCWGGEELTLASSDGGGLTDPLVDRDMTQVLYQKDGRCWYVEPGKEPVAVTGLPEDVELSPLFPPQNGISYNGYPAVSHLTNWVYRGSTGHLYYLDDHLTATDLTPDHRVRDYVIDEAGTTLYWSGASGGLFRMDRPGPGATSVQIEERSGWELSAAPDLSVVGYQVWQDGKSTYALLDTRSGERTVLNVTENFRGTSLCPLKGGGCWRLTADRQLWFWSGETGALQLPVDETQAKTKKLWSGANGQFQRVGDGSQAVLRLSFSGSPYAPGLGDCEYWLLDNRGSATKLEIRDYVLEE